MGNLFPKSTHSFDNKKDIVLSSSAYNYTHD